MARQYVQRLAHWSSSKSLVAPPLAYLRPAIYAQRLLTFNAASQQKSSQPSSPVTTTTSTTTPITSSSNVNLFDTSSIHDPLFKAAVAAAATNAQHQERIKKSEPVETESTAAAAECFQFVAHAAWHPKSRNARQRRSEEKLPYWKRSKIGNVDAGEDAFFHTYTPYGMALGVADGVGGWAEAGVDPAIFSWTLMNNAAGIAKKSAQHPPIDALQILDTAFHQLRKSGKVAAGSSTACILNLCKSTGEMTSVNLGDSAFLLIRDKKIVYESPSQQHYFNCPYQLTVVPDSYPDRDSFVTDLPKDADQKTFFLKDNDIILLATDGYFDNVYPHETLEIVTQHMASVMSGEPVTDTEVAAAVRALAKALTDTARRFSLDPKRLSPWARDAQAHGSNYRGGKVDDITCIVTLVRGLQKSEKV